MKTNLRLGEMILSDDEINLLVREASRNSAINRDGTTSQRIARAIEAKVLEKLSDKLRDGERYRWLRLEHDRIDPLGRMCWKRYDNRNGSEWCEVVDIDQAIDAAIKESK